MNNEDLTLSAFGCSWQLIFFHNATGQNLFNKASGEALFVNTTQKFSILGSLTNNFKRNGYFEFLLEYPEMSYNNEVYRIRWRQKKNPIKAVSGTDIGYTPIHVPSNRVNFAGLVVSTESSATFLDGTHSGWFYAIGSYAHYMDKNTFPGPYRTDSSGKEIAVSLAKLYVRIYNTCSCRIRRTSLSNLLLIQLIICS